MQLSNDVLINEQRHKAASIHFRRGLKTKWQLYSCFFFPKWFKFPWSINKRSWQHVWKRLHFSSMWSLVSGRPLGGLPEGVSEVNAPSLELLRVVGGHVGEFSEDVEVCGVSWWSEGGGKKKRRACENDVIRGPAARLKPGLSRSGSVSQKHLLTFYEAWWRKWSGGGGRVNGAEKTASLFQPRPESKTVPLSGPW